MKNKFHYSICLNSKCDFVKKTPYDDDIEEFCPKCGNILTWICPSCQRALQNLDREFCSWCGDALVKIDDLT